MKLCIIFSLAWLSACSYKPDGSVRVVNSGYSLAQKKRVSAEERASFVATPDQGSAVETVDQALEYLTDLDAGAVDAQGKFPAESFNGRVQRSWNNSIP